MARIAYSSSEITLFDLPESVTSLDIYFDEARVWSVEVEQEADAEFRPQQAGKGAPGVEVPAFVFAWPDSLVAYLQGITRILVTDSATGQQIIEADAQFGASTARIQLLDADGTQLSVNKWGRLGRTLESLGQGVQQQIIARAQTLMHELTQYGLRPFLVGGTLLGAVRSQALLAHDDDADIAYLSVHQNPVDVALEGFRLGRHLESLGYEFDRHSAAHMQLLFRDEQGQIQFYIDIFSAFFTDDGCINQPFHVRGPMRQDQMLPFSQVTISGSRFPAPQDTDAWLTLNYDANWRTPQPGFQIVTPEDTRFRFNAWFGGYNFLREFWDDLYLAGADRAPWLPGAAWLSAQAELMSAPTLVLLGSGDGEFAIELAAQCENRSVIGLDFSEQANRQASRRRDAHASIALQDRVTFVKDNLYLTSSLLRAHDFGAAGAFDLLGNHLLGQIGHHARAQVWRMSRLALKSGGSASFTVNEAPAVDFSGEDPRTWHLESAELSAEAASYGLSLDFTTIDSLSTRHPVGVRAHLNAQEAA